MRLMTRGAYALGPGGQDCGQTAARPPPASTLALVATPTVKILRAFEGMPNQIVSLSLFMPLLIGVGGNARAQSAPTIVRAIAVNDVRSGDVARGTLREIRVRLLLGVTLAVLGFFVVWLFFRQALAAVVSAPLSPRWAMPPGCSCTS
jgi:magnesium transporter